MTDHEIAPEFSRTILADKVGTDETVQTIKAGRMRKLAERLDLQSLEPERHHPPRRIRGGKMIRVVGQWKPMVQTCVVTLEPVANHVSDEFETIFAPHLIPAVSAKSRSTRTRKPPEPLIDNRIDLGERPPSSLLDPYPRCPGIDFEDHIERRKSCCPAHTFLAPKLKRPD